MADETKVMVDVNVEVAAATEEAKAETAEILTEEIKAEETVAPAEEAVSKEDIFSAEKPVEEEKAEKPKKEKKAKKEKKPRKPFFFDTAVSPQGLFGRCALIVLHTIAIAFAVLWLFGGLEMLINNNPSTFSFVYPFANAAMHGLIGMGVAFAYGIARIVCVIVRYNKKNKKKSEININVTVDNKVEVKVEK